MYINIVEDTLEIQENNLSQHSETVNEYGANDLYIG